MAINLASTLRNRVLERAQDLVMEAASDMRERLDRAVPVGNYTSVSRRDQARPKLKDTYGQQFYTDDNKAGVTIRYTADHAEWTDKGTSPHLIPTGGPQDGVRLRFFWENQNKWVDTAFVDHPGITERSPSYGWFSDNANAETWQEDLQNAAQ